MSRTDAHRTPGVPNRGKQPLAEGRDTARVRSILTRAQATRVSELLDDTCDLSTFEPTRTRRTR